MDVANQHGFKLAHLLPHDRQPIRLFNAQRLPVAQGPWRRSSPVLVHAMLTLLLVCSSSYIKYIHWQPSSASSLGPQSVYRHVSPRPLLDTQTTFHDHHIDPASQFSLHPGHLWCVGFLWWR